MNALNSMERSERLGEICQAIGFTLLQLQTLEGSTAQYFVLVEQAIPQMGEEEGNALVAKAQKKTFGGSITRLEKANQLPGDLLERFQVLLTDRNWLVHSSASDSRKAMANDSAYTGFHRRLEAIQDEAARLLKEISVLSEKFVLGHGISMEAMEAKLAETLRQWQS
jgi:hypothetical protein